MCQIFQKYPQTLVFNLYLLIGIVSLKINQGQYFSNLVHTNHNRGKSGVRRNLMVTDDDNQTWFHSGI